MNSVHQQIYQDTMEFDWFLGASVFLLVFLSSVWVFWMDLVVECPGWVPKERHAWPEWHRLGRESHSIPLITSPTLRQVQSPWRSRTRREDTIQVGIQQGLQLCGLETSLWHLENTVCPTEGRHWFPQLPGFSVSCAVPRGSFFLRKCWWLWMIKYFRLFISSTA